jgi:glycosyltransferase involved in cell wall biosynthesis
MIVGLFTEMLSVGGVQRAGRQVAAVTAKFAAERGLGCHYLSLNDSQGEHAVRVGPHEFSVSGHARDKSRFVLSALRAAGRQPLLVIALHPHLAPVAALMRLRSRKFRSIVFTHGIEVWRPLAWPRGPALRSADLVTAPSRDTAQHVIYEQGIRTERVRQLPWGLDPDFEARLQAPARPARPVAFPEPARIILTVGRWNPAERYKGADTLISALPRVLQAVPDAVLVLIGDGEDRPRLELLARTSGFMDHIRFLCSPTQDELFACYAHCDVFALPSRGEGFGLVFLEAMALGKPVIGGAHGGIPDVIEDGVNGLLVPHGDIPRLSSVLESLLLDRVRASEMGARGYQQVQMEFTFEQFQSRLTRTLREALIAEPCGARFEGRKTP